MERHNEILRQWEILNQISSAADWTVTRLTQHHKVCRKTIERDLLVLTSAGFPIRDLQEGRFKYWRLLHEPFPGLKGTEFTFGELCAFYINRARLTSAGGSPVDKALQSAVTKVSASLNPKMRAYLDKLSAVVTWKAEPAPRGNPQGQAEYREDITRAMLDHRVMRMVYYSASSRRTKEYEVEPYRLTVAKGGDYMFAFVPDGSRWCCFALGRIRRLTVLERTFTPVPLPGDPFGDSMDVFTGKADTVSLHFSAQMAPYIEERQWRPLQSIEKQADGSVVLTMSVSVDFALRSWVLGFGRHVRVLKPQSLVREITAELEGASRHYASLAASRASLELFLPDDDKQIHLPFRSGDSRQPTASGKRAS